MDEEPFDPHPRTTFSGHSLKNAIFLLLGFVSYFLFVSLLIQVGVLHRINFQEIAYFKFLA